MIYMHGKAEESKAGTEFIHIVVSHLYRSGVGGLSFGVGEAKLELE